MNRGYIGLWRKIQDHQFWKEKRAFSRAEAWIDILMSVRWKRDPEDVLIGNKVFVCNYAESLKSLETWSRRWGWSKHKCRDFLQLLNTTKMIEIENLTVTTRITVCNYEQYNPKENASGTVRERLGNASGTRRDPEEESKKEKNVKKETKKQTQHFVLPDCVDSLLWKDFREHREKLRKPMTMRAEKGVVEQAQKLAEQTGDDINALIEYAIIKGWLTIYPIKDCDRNGNIQKGRWFNYESAAAEFSEEREVDA